VCEAFYDTLLNAYGFEDKPAYCVYWSRRMAGGPGVIGAETGGSARGR
jgi:hypothetical protein